MHRQCSITCGSPGARPCSSTLVHPCLPLHSCHQHLAPSKILRSHLFPSAPSLPCLTLAATLHARAASPSQPLPLLPFHHPALLRCLPPPCTLMLPPSPSSPSPPTLPHTPGSNGLFVVGPESAAAHPGPVCYKKGGYLAITDANLALGRVLPDFFPKVLPRGAGRAGRRGKGGEGEETGKGGEKQGGRRGERAIHWCFAISNASFATAAAAAALACIALVPAKRSGVPLLPEAAGRQHPNPDP